MPKSWFITGATSGFGREWTLAALERGDRVAATARDATRLDDLAERFGDRFLPVDLDVTDRDAAFAAVSGAAAQLGALDVVVNNAGAIHFGMVEELEEAEVRAQLEVNFLGALWVTQAALGVMRAQRSGHLVQVTSEGGVIAYPGVGAYHASKWALEGLSQSLAQEVAGLGIDITLVEPGPYETGLGGAASTSATRLADYDDVRAAASFPDFGDPTATRAAILALVGADDPPRRLLLGSTQVDTVVADYEERIATWRAWEDVSVAAHG